MKIELKHITVKDIFDGYLNDDENNGGVVGYGELLNIRPAYQRNYVYKDKQRDKVIDTVLKGLPLNVMYWVHNEDDTYEVLDGQQRTISICDFVNGDFSVLWNGKTHYFYTLTEDVKKKILEYELTVYICEGTDSEKLDWFQTINIAGEKLLDQELRNAVYYGPWLADAKRFFSKRDCIAKRIGERYMVGDPNRQQYLETVLRWVSNDDINKYMAEHKNLPNANQLKQYFRNMVAWLNDTFEYRKEMCGVPKICLEEDFLPCGKMESFHLKDSLFEVLVYRRNKGYRPRYNFYNLGLAEAMLNKMPIRHCVHCVNYGRCTIPMECQVFNRRTRQMEKGVQQVFNHRVKEDKVDKYELADKCNNWKLNEASCQRIISDYQHHDIFIWTPDMDDLPE